MKLSNCIISTITVSFAMLFGCAPAPILERDNSQKESTLSAPIETEGEGTLKIIVDYYYVDKGNGVDMHPTGGICKESFYINPYSETNDGGGTAVKMPPYATDSWKIIGFDKPWPNNQPAIVFESNETPVGKYTMRRVNQCLTSYDYSAKGDFIVSKGRITVVVYRYRAGTGSFGSSKADIISYFEDTVSKEQPGKEVKEAF